MSRRVVFSVLLLVCCHLFKAQSALYQKVVAALKENHPEISISDKIVTVNFWSANDQHAREANKSFEKAYKAYIYAKLKGGVKGLIAITINTDANASEAAIVLRKDGIIKTVLFDKAQIKDLGDLQSGNFVFNSLGFEIYKDLKPENIFQSINNLITR